jgi:CheY-like chemotaxis protein
LKTVAVLDDDQALVDLYKTVLEDEGYTVHSVAISRQPAQILADLKTVNPDLLILDVHIPGLNSFDILKSIQTRPDMAKLKVLVCSASQPSLDSLQALLAEAHLVNPSVLQKPFDLDDLSQEVLKMLQVSN